MTRDLTAVFPDTTLAEVARTMAQHRVTGLPVVDAEDRVVGFVSERDLIAAAVPTRSFDGDQFFAREFVDVARALHNVGDLPVSEYMAEAVTGGEDDDIYALVDLMIGGGYQVLPVVRDGRLVGVVNRAQVCSSLMEQEAQGSEGG